VADSYRASNITVRQERELARPAPAGDVAKRIWRQFRATWADIASRISFWTVIAATICLSSIYYFVFAESLYDSNTVISVQNKSASSMSSLGGLLGSAAGASQVEQLYQYITSHDMLKILDQKFHLRKIYSSEDRNPFWRLWWPQSDEAFLKFYQNMIEVQPDTTDSLLTVDVLDYDKIRAHAIAAEILAQLQKFMNAQSAIMQAQTMKYAQDELGNAVKAVQTAKIPYEQSVAETRLTAAEQALATAAGMANAQQTFIIPVASPSIPTVTTRPQRLLDIAGLTLVVALAYAVGFLMWANVRDHRKT
jgi:capsule polysaccharide export protein KpsE/RkpR